MRKDIYIVSVPEQVLVKKVPSAIARILQNDCELQKLASTKYKSAFVNVIVCCEGRIAMLSTCTYHQCCIIVQNYLILNSNNTIITCFIYIQSMRNTYPQVISSSGLQYTSESTCRIDPIDIIEQFYNHQKQKAQSLILTLKSIHYSSTSIRQTSKQLSQYQDQSSDDHDNTNQEFNFNFYTHKQILQEEEEAFHMTLINLDQSDYIKIMQLIGRLLFRQEYTNLKILRKVKQNYQTELINIKLNYASHKQMLNSYMEENQWLKDQLTQQRSQKSQIQHKLNQSQEEIMASKQFVNVQQKSKEKLIYKVQNFQSRVQELQQYLQTVSKQLQRNKAFVKSQEEEIKRLKIQKKQYLTQVKNSQKINELLSIQNQKMTQQIEELKNHFIEKPSYINYLENSNSNIKKSIEGESQNSENKIIKIGKFDTVIQQYEEFSDQDIDSKRSNSQKSGLRNIQKDWNIQEMQYMKDLHFYEHSAMKRQKSQVCSYESLSSHGKHQFQSGKKQFSFSFYKNIGSDRRLSFGNQKKSQLINSSKERISLEKNIQKNPNIYICDMDSCEKLNQTKVRSSVKHNEKFKSLKIDNQTYTGNEEEVDFYESKKLQFVQEKTQSQQEENLPYAPVTKNIQKKEIQNTNITILLTQNKVIKKSQSFSELLKTDQQQKRKRSPSNLNIKKSPKTRNAQQLSLQCEQINIENSKIKRLSHYIQVLKLELLNKNERLHQIQGQNQIVLAELTDKIQFQRNQLKKLSQKCIIFSSQNSILRQQNSDFNQILKQIQIQLKQCERSLLDLKKENQRLNRILQETQQAQNARISKVKQFCKKHIEKLTEQFQQNLEKFNLKIRQFQIFAKESQEDILKQEVRKNITKKRSQKEVQAINSRNLRLQLQTINFLVNQKCSQKQKLPQSSNLTLTLTSLRQKQNSQAQKIQTKSHNLRQFCESSLVNGYKQSESKLNNQPDSFSHNNSYQKQEKNSQIQIHDNFNIQNGDLNLEINRFYFLSKLEIKNLTQHSKIYKELTQKQTLRFQQFSHTKDFKYNQINSSVYILKVSQQNIKQQEKLRQQSLIHMLLTGNILLNLKDMSQALQSQQPIVVKDFNMLILGNCQLIIQKGQLIISREKKRCHFKGQITDGCWKIHKIYKAIVKQQKLI